MPTYRTIRRVNHDGYLYAIGEEIELTEVQAASLLASGAISLSTSSPTPPEPTPTPPTPEPGSPPPNPRTDSETPSTEEEADLGQSVDPVLVNVNTATSVELQVLEFVGPAIAKRIIDKRPYETLAEVEAAAKMPPDQWAVIKPQLAL